MTQDAAKRAECSCKGCSGCAPHVCRPEWPLVILCKVCHDAAVAEACQETKRQCDLVLEEHVAFKVAEVVSRTKADAVALCAAEFERGLLSGRAEVTEAVKERDEHWRKERIQLITDAQLDLNEARREEREELQAMIERKNAALARPCINCGYQPKIVTPASAPEGAGDGHDDAAADDEYFERNPGRA